MKLSVLIGRTPKPSVTLAGDISQKLFLDNGFGDWRAVLGHLSLSHVAVEPLRIAYRSTREILALAREAMGPLADALPPEAPRSGAPVEAFRFPAVGAAVAFLGEALRDLHSREPRATVALLARHPEQADRYFDGLRRGARAAPRARAGVLVPPRRRGHGRAPGQRPRVRLRRHARRQRLELRPRRRVTPPFPHRRHARRAPAVARRDRHADAAHAKGAAPRLSAGVSPAARPAARRRCRRWAAPRTGASPPRPRAPRPSRAGPRARARGAARPSDPAGVGR